MQPTALAAPHLRWSHFATTSIFSVAVRQVSGQEGYPSHGLRVSEGLRREPHPLKSKGVRHQLPSCATRPFLALCCEPRRV